MQQRASLYFRFDLLNLSSEIKTRLLTALCQERVIGQRLRALRHQRPLSLEVSAERSGVRRLASPSQRTAAGCRAMVSATSDFARAPDMTPAGAASSTCRAGFGWVPDT